MLSDGQFAILTTAILAAGSGFVAVVRWFGKSFIETISERAKEFTSAMKEAREEARMMTGTMIRLESIVREGRDDIRELKLDVSDMKGDIATLMAALVKRPSEESERIRVTPPAGTPKKKV